MRNTVDELASFYATRTGQRVAAAVRQKLQPHLLSRSTDRLLGLGYCPPFLSDLPGGRERTVLLMPARQGARCWPENAANLAAQGDLLAMPFADAFFDQVVLAHALEFIDPARHGLRELWRVLAPGGTVLIVVANRRGVWTHFETTPFGNGRPFGRRQLDALLVDAMFEPLSWNTALVMPPVRGLAPLERVASWFWPEIGGILIVKARKRDGLAPIRGLKARATVPAAAGLS